MTKRLAMLVGLLAMGVAMGGCDSGSEGSRAADGGADAAGNGGDADADADTDADTDTDTTPLNADWKALCAEYRRCTTGFQETYGSLAGCVAEKMEELGPEVGAECNAKCGAMTKCENSILCIMNCEEGANREYCPGYKGNMMCCQVDPPPGVCTTWVENGECDCDGTCAWDAVDCGR